MLYVLQLQRNRIFVYYNSSVIRDSLADIQRECLFLYDFTKKYPVESIIETITNCRFDQVNQTVKQYMILYGMDYVRGGSYSDIDLSKEQVAFINAELSYNNHITSSEIILELYNEIGDAPVEKRAEIEESWSRYMALKEQYQGLITINDNNSLDCAWLTRELEWMKKQLTDQLINGISKDCGQDFTRYMTIISYLKRLPSIAESIRHNTDQSPFDFRKIFEPMKNPSLLPDYKNGYTDVDQNQDQMDTYMLEYDYITEPDDFTVFVNNPQFIFDSYFVTHKWSSLDHPKTPKFILHVFAIIMYFFNYIKNYLMDLEYAIDNFAFITNMKYEHCPPTVWREIYSDFIDKYWDMANYSPNTDGMTNLANDDAE